LSGAGGGVYGDLVFNGYRISVWEDEEEVLETTWWRWLQDNKSVPNTTELNICDMVQKGAGRGQLSGRT
jgi:hypothetical protein